MKQIVAVGAKVGTMVLIGGYDDNASEKQMNFVDAHEGEMFEIEEVGNYSSKLKGVPFCVKHAHIYEYATSRS